MGVLDTVSFEADTTAYDSLTVTDGCRPAEYLASDNYDDIHSFSRAKLEKMLRAL